MEKYAVLSKSAYDFYYEGSEKAQQELEEYGYGQFQIDPTLSSNMAVVSESPDEVVIAYRGTDFSNPNDVLTDFSILMGRHRGGHIFFPDMIPDRFNRANELYQRVKEKTNKDITLTGHSLGNTLALYVGRQNAENSVGFNAGASYNDVLIGKLCKMTGGCDDNKIHTIYTTGKDFISYGNLFGNENVIVVDTPQKLDMVYHTLDYFMPVRKGSKPHPKYFEPKQFTKKQKYLDTDTLDYFKRFNRRLA